MKSSPDNLGQVNVPTRPRHSTDALAPICDINEQCLRMLVTASRATDALAEPFLQPLLSLLANLDESTLASAARFPFLLVDFGFDDPHWWQAVIMDSRAQPVHDPWTVAFPREPMMRLARATAMLAWHTIRTDTEASLILLGISPEVASIFRSLRLHDLDVLAERHAQDLLPRWHNQPGVWRQLISCAKSTEVEAAHEFVLHALQLAARASLPGITAAIARPRLSCERRPSI
ncbi:MAG: hypothetical protein QM718_10740 [Steroidobacteraceae bacterium]